MAYQLINKLEQFNFQHGTLRSCQTAGDAVCLELDGAVALYDNDFNDRSVNTYISTLSLQLFHARTESLVLEGFKYFDADHTLLEEVEDKPMKPEDLGNVMKLCEGGYLAAADVSGQEGAFSLQLQVDAVDSNDTYCVTFSFEKSSSTWERFLQKAEE